MKKTYKILINPTTFESFVQEITIIENDTGIRLEKRVMDFRDVKDTWSEEQFITEMSKHGYETAAHYFIEAFW